MTPPRRPAAVLRSPRNPRVKAAAALLERRARDREGRYLVEGPRYVEDLLDGGDLEEVFALPSLAGRLAAGGAPVTPVDEPVLRRLTSSVTPQGVVAVARQRRALLREVLGSGFVVVLCGVADPGNAGSAVRTAAAAGAAGTVFTSGSVDPWNPKAVRASAGAVARLPMVVDVSVDEVLAACDAAGQRAVALDAAGTTSIDDPQALAPPVALLFGNEAHGLPSSATGKVARVVAIPRYGPVESLNLAAAVAVTAYAAARAARRGFG